MPTVLGHEIVGRIEAFGPEACHVDLAGRPLRQGDLISWAVVANCGDCFYCQHDVEQKCTQSTKYGHEAMRPGRELLGGLAEHCLLVRGTRIMAWPDSMPLSIACPASCATSTSMAAIEKAAAGRSNSLADSCVVVFGAGMLGLTTCAIARTQGAQHVIAVDPVMERRQLALRFGAHALSAEQLDTAVHELTAGRGADAAIENVRLASRDGPGVKALRIGGRLVLIGAVYPTPPVELSMEQIIRKCLRIEGVHNYAPRHLRQAVEFLAAIYERRTTDHKLEFPFESLVSDWYSLNDVQTALKAASRPGTVRIGVSVEQ